MGKYNGAIVTTVGQNLIANAVASNQKVIFTKLKASTHVYAPTTDFEAMTSISDIVQSVDISYAGVYNNNVIQVSGRFTNNGVVTPFTINTIGLYGKVGSGSETLVAVVTAVNADTMPVADPVSPTAIVYNIQMTVQNSGVMEVEVNDAGTINVHQFNDALYSTALITVPTTGWTQNGSQYTKTIDVGGITSSSMPFVELKYPDNVTATQKKAIDKAASKLVSLTTTNYGQVLLTATAVPETSFDMLLRGLGSGQYTQPYNEFFTTVLDKEPYVSRSARDGLVKLSLMGATVAWNQLVQNGNFADTSEWIAVRSSISAANNKITITANGSAAFMGIQQDLDSIPSNHVLYVEYDFDASSISNFNSAKFQVIESSTYTTIKSNTNNKGLNSIVFKRSANLTGIQSLFFKTGENFASTDKITMSYIILHDLTQMFGTTIADYVYSLEQATEGSGIAWLKSYGFFTKDYYAYDAGSLQSVCTSARKITALDGTVRTYPIDNEELRGLFKLDANNKLYADGDIYKSSGAVTRKYATYTFTGSETVYAKQQIGTYYRYSIECEAFGNKSQHKSIWSNGVQLKYNYSEDSSHYYIQDNTIWYFTTAPTNAAMLSEISGTTLLADLQTETAETADPYINPQRSDNGTEEFVDGLTRDVMIPVGNESTYYLSEVLPSAADYTDGQVEKTQQLVAPIQSNLTASKAYAKGEQFIYNGLLYKAKSSITSGATITIGTNAELADCVTKQIKEYKETSITTGFETGYSGYIKLKTHEYKQICQVELDLTVSKTLNNSWDDILSDAVLESIRTSAYPICINSSTGTAGILQVYLKDGVPTLRCQVSATSGNTLRALFFITMK